MFPGIASPRSTGRPRPVLKDRPAAGWQRHSQQEAEEAEEEEEEEEEEEVEVVEDVVVVVVAVVVVVVACGVPVASPRDA